jgi:hypothetical protein
MPMLGNDALRLYNLSPNSLRFSPSSLRKSPAHTADDLTTFTTPSKKLYPWKNVPRWSKLYDKLQQQALHARDDSGQSTSAIKFHSQSTSAFTRLGARADSHKDARLRYTPYRRASLTGAHLIQACISYRCAFLLQACISLIGVHLLQACTQ